MRIKVCGIRNQKNLSFLNESDVDFIGFIFYAKSSRNFDGGNVESIESSKKKVGVFVNEDISTVENLAKTHRLDYLQLHGDETPDYCKTLKNKGYRLFKAFSVEDELPMHLDAYKSFVDYFLFDTKGKNYGGNGKQFNWSVLEDYELETPFILSGGIGPNDIERLQSLNNPRLYAVDVNSRFEISPGLKDESVLKEFIKKIKE